VLRASPRAQFFAQLVGSTASVGVTVLAYQLYSRLYQIPSTQFPAPTAHVWADMAKLMQGGLGALPPTAKLFGSGFAAVGAALPLAEALLPHRTTALLPSGISFGIGMYVTADWTIPRVLGAVGERLWQRLSPRTHDGHMLMVASGFVLGEGVMSMLALILTAAGVPRLHGWG